MAHLKRLAFLLACSTSMIAFSMADEGGGGGASTRSALSVADALAALNPEDDNDWTEAGLPAMDRMKDLTDRADLLRAEVGEAKPGFNRSDALEKATPHLGAGRLQTGNSGGDGKNAEDAEVLKGTGDDKTTTTAADALRADRKGEDFGVDPADQPEPEIPIDSRGRPATEIDVQAVGLEEKLSPEEAQAQSAAALAGDNSDQNDYDAGFVRGYELGKTEAAKGTAEQADPASVPETTREQRNEEVNTTSAAAPAKASTSIDAILEAAGGDAIALCEALSIAASGDRYRRNSALGSFVRGYQVAQGEIKEIQRRLTLREEQRSDASKLAAEAEARARNRRKA